MQSISDGHNSILSQEYIEFDRDQLRSMSTHGFSTNDILNPCQKNQQFFPFITERQVLSLSCVGYECNNVFSSAVFS